MIMEAGFPDHAKLVNRILREWPGAATHKMHSAIKTVLMAAWEADAANEHPDDRYPFEDHWKEIRTQYLNFLPDAWIMAFGGRLEPFTLLCFEADNTSRTGWHKIRRYVYAYDELHGDIDLRLISYDANGHAKELELHWLSGYVLMKEACRPKEKITNAKVWMEHDQAVAAGAAAPKPTIPQNEAGGWVVDNTPRPNVEVE